MNYFRYRHAAETWAYQQKQWYGRETRIIELDRPTREGARWVVME